VQIARCYQKPRSVQLGQAWICSHVLQVPEANSNGPFGSALHGIISPGIEGVFDQVGDDPARLYAHEVERLARPS
jgi:hypothetical protein